MRLRVEAGVSQYDLAQRLGVAQGTVSKWENGAPMSAAALWAAAESLNLPPWLVLAMAEAQHDQPLMHPGMIDTVRVLLSSPTEKTIP